MFFFRKSPKVARRQRVKRQWLQVCLWTFIFETLFIRHL